MVSTCCKGIIILILLKRSMINLLQDKDPRIQVLELRNYLLKPGSADEFSSYFSTHFVKPMAALGGYTLGQFKIQGVQDRFVWLRGFISMEARLKFLNDFYMDSPVWKEFGPGANELMINSDNVYLLKPLKNSGIYSGHSPQMKNNVSTTAGGVVVVDFYICNSTLDKVIDLFNSVWLPYLQTLDIHDITVWVSEMSENDFPRLPVFQDINLLLTITTYKDEKEYQIKKEQINFMPRELKRSIQELITMQSDLVLCPTANMLV
jgi:hypothetical protein